MKFLTIDDGTADGRVHLVSRNGQRVVPLDHVRTLQEALEVWDDHVAHWQAQSDQLNAQPDAGAPYVPEAALAPLPRAWQWLDGSAFATHMSLMQKAWNLPEQGLPKRPLMYQGLSNQFLPPVGTARFPTDEDGIDFEGEYGVITGPVAMGTTAEQAGSQIRLVVLINDWSLRGLGPAEMATGFGWLQCKPACGIAPFAVTPDELGQGWRDHRVCLPLQIELNAELFGQANGDQMAFGFNDLIAHAAYSRDLPAGTILGSGTVANAEYATVGSSCIAERRAIEQIASGAGKTPFLTQDDHVVMWAVDADEVSVFGRIDQRVVTGLAS